MKKTILKSFMAALLLCGCSSKEKLEEGLESYSTPKVYRYDKDGQYEVQIPLPFFPPKDGKKMFMKLFEHYGFSGNGPSIEQVICENIDTSYGMTDSEGDCFRIVFKTKNDLDKFEKDVKAIEDVKVLNDWLHNAQSILIKE